MTTKVVDASEANPELAAIVGMTAEMKGRPVWQILMEGLSDKVAVLESIENSEKAVVSIRFNGQTLEVPREDVLRHLREHR